MENNTTMQKLKEQRLTPADKFVLDAIKGAKANEPDENGDVRWYKDGDCLFKQSFKSGYLWVNYSAIWLVLQGEHGLEDNKIQQLIKNVMYKYTNNGRLRVI
jgi:hypothetical protein